jgi:hypothetical protein
MGGNLFSLLDIEFLLRPNAEMIASFSVHSATAAEKSTYRPHWGRNDPQWQYSVRAKDVLPFLFPSLISFCFLLTFLTFLD